MDELESELKRLLVQALELEDVAPEDIDSEEALFGEGLGLDSIDGLELGVALRKAYGIRIDATGEALKAAFANVRSLARFVAAQRALQMGAA